MAFDPVLQEIIQIAHNIRAELEKSLEDEFSGVFYGDLTGMCAIATSKLFQKCVERNFDVKIAYNHNHVFLRYKRYVIDITATQFGSKFKKVEVRPLKEMRQLKTSQPNWGKTYWDVKERFSSVEDLRAHLFKENWPKYQIPHVV